MKEGGNSANMMQSASMDIPRTSHNVSNHIVMMAANTNPTSCYGWLADLATTSHVACDETQFTVYQKINQTITGVGNIHISAIGHGTINLTTHVDGSRRDIILNDVLHVPTAKDSLFSVSCFVEQGNTFLADKTGGYFYNSNGQLIMTSKLENTLFSLNATIPKEKVNVIHGTLSWMEWC